jgi:hypothetical protein
MLIERLLSSCLYAKRSNALRNCLNHLSC